MSSSPRCRIHSGIAQKRLSRRKIVMPRPERAAGGFCGVKVLRIQRDPWRTLREGTLRRPSVSVFVVIYVFFVCISGQLREGELNGGDFGPDRSFRTWDPT